MGDRIDRLAARMPFLAYAVWHWARGVYDGIPGPAWLKLPLVVVLLLTPGPDELLVIAAPVIARGIRAMVRRMRDGR